MTEKNNKVLAQDYVINYLIKNALECTWYVGGGDVLRKEIQGKFSLTEEEARDLTSVITHNLTMKIMEIERVI